MDHLENDGTAANDGIEIDGKSNIAIDNVKIGVSITPGAANYAQGIDIVNGSNVNGGIANSTIYAASAAADAYGIRIAASSIADITDNTVTTFSGSGGALSFGIFLCQRSTCRYLQRHKHNKYR